MLRVYLFCTKLWLQNILFLNIFLPPFVCATLKISMAHPVGCNESLTCLCIVTKNGRTNTAPEHFFLPDITVPMVALIEMQQNIVQNYICGGA